MLRLLRIAPLLLALASVPVRAQQPLPIEEGLDPDAVVEEPDPTRLDVERLPPEAITIERGMYARGFFVETALGGRGFVGGVGDYARGGPALSFGLGYELTRSVALRLAVDMSMHTTNAPAPPAQSVFEVVQALAEVRFTANFSARTAMFFGAEVGALWVTSNVLRAYGFRDTGRTGLAVGGQLGLDFHMRSRHHSIGLLGGARWHPTLDRGEGACVGVHGQMYLRYVFGG